MSVCVEAANALDLGLEVFYPSTESRKELLSLLVSRGGIVEVNVLWAPARDPVRWRGAWGWTLLGGWCWGEVVRLTLSMYLRVCCPSCVVFYLCLLADGQDT